MESRRKGGANFKRLIESDKKFPTVVQLFECSDNCPCGVSVVVCWCVWGGGGKLFLYKQQLNILFCFLPNRCYEGYDLTSGPAILLPSAISLTGRHSLSIDGCKHRYKYNTLTVFFLCTEIGPSLSVTICPFPSFLTDQESEIEPAAYSHQELILTVSIA